MSTDKPEDNLSSQKRLFIPSVAVSALAIAVSNTIVTLLLLEIASTFNVEQGIAAQIRTVNAAAEMIFAILTGFLAVRYRHKSLLLLGLLLISISAIGTFFASTLGMMLFFSFLEGSGTVLVLVMILTIIGDSLSLDKKHRAAIWVVIAGFISTLAGTPTINFIAGSSSWRFAFLLLVLPISIIGVLLVLRSVPNRKSVQLAKVGRKAYFQGFKQVLSDKSAASFLVSSMFFTGIGNAIFALAFFRQRFLLPLEYIVYIILVGASIYIISGLFTSRFAYKIGIKRLTIMGALVSGILIILIFCSTNIWMALTFNYLQTFFTAMALSAYPCLALDQVPTSRSTMMSLSRIFVNAGGTIAPAIGGALLVIFSAQSMETGYMTVGLTYGVMNIIASAILYFFTKDTTKLAPISVV
jgi:MFS transporter, DHA1 family, multidrug resistance protein